MTHTVSNAPAGEVFDGVVARLVPAKGFGFITHRNPNSVAGGVDYFFHLSDLQNCQLSELLLGDRVQFVPEPSTKGNGRRARTVELVGR